jgi:hypothetical protein
MPNFPVYYPITGRMYKNWTAVHGWLQYSPYRWCWSTKKIFLTYKTCTGEQTQPQRGQHPKGNKEWQSKKQTLNSLFCNVTSCWLQRSLLESRVQSTFAILTYGLPTNLMPNSSHVGANLLQWPHLEQKQTSYKKDTLFHKDISCTGYFMLSKVKSRNILWKNAKWKLIKHASLTPATS